MSRDVYTQLLLSLQLAHDLVCIVAYLLKEHSHDFTYRAQMIVLNVYNATSDDLRRCTFFGRQ